MPNIPLDEEQIERIFAELGRGNIKCFYELTSYFLDTLVEELSSFEHYQDLLGVGLLSLFCAIKSYNREKQSIATIYIRKYIHLSLLIYRENHIELDTSCLELHFPTYGITITNLEFHQYLDKIKEKIALEKPRSYIYN